MIVLCSSFRSRFLQILKRFLLFWVYQLKGKVMSKMNLEHDSYVRKEQVNELTEILVIVQFCLFRTSTLGLLPEDVKFLLRKWKEDVDFLLKRLNDLPF